MGKTIIRWTSEELSVLRRMLDEGAPHARIAAALFMDVIRVKARVCYETRDETARQKRRESINAARQRRAIGFSSSPKARIHGASATSGGRPAADLLDDAKRRLLAPRTLSQQLLGDPAPGYSALDRKRQNIPEPHYVDRRSAQHGPKPTLAGLLA